uniref:Uncharacterized protein n=1 Tax=Romanomermis culicivorax TaxID=13658 RepID=A0A915IK16_ROMCU
MLLCIKEFLPLAQIRDFNYKDTKFRCRADNGGPLAASTPINNHGQQQPATSLISVDTDKASIVEIVIPSLTVNLRYQDSQGKPKLVLLESDLQAMTRLMAMVVETMDTLLEDWYPSLGTRFVHTSEGKYLVNRIVPCPYCLLLTNGNLRRMSSDQLLINSSEDWSIFSLSKNSPSDQIGRSVQQHAKCAALAAQSTSNIAKPDGRVIKSKTFDCSSSGIQRRASTSSQDSGLNESSAFAGAEIA